MQTFLPYADFERSARALDTKRLGKQRVETLQVMRALTVEGYGWRHHPVAKMWRGHRPSLMVYQDATCTEWERRGFADTCREKTLAVLAIPSLLSRQNLRVPVIDELLAYELGQTPPPPWLGREDIHESHRSNLLRKDPEFYGELFPDTPADLDYVWPVPKGAP
ncbi:hypothetical protein ELQ92_14380 [Labedella populi]|uniref:Cytoplasmic protein n=1 Tax=Labedella populi TaxID=2498850 RepID=A0A3S5CIJ3_9MICO|nr:MSMEG_6728 family protein [Labedella populi]RWZ58486.1 hypothetical protein ELQ92_14380 [Labedella populi]